MREEVGLEEYAGTNVRVAESSSLPLRGAGMLPEVHPPRPGLFEIWPWSDLLVVSWQLSFFPTHPSSPLVSFRVASLFVLHPRNERRWW
jgi:hypothetical protein